MGYQLYCGTQRTDCAPTGLTVNRDANHVFDDSLGTAYIFASGVAQIEWDKKLINVKFDPPLRIRRHRVIDIQLTGRDATFSNIYHPNLSIHASILYTEMPNPRGEYET
jgi:hypothetical protein